MFHAYFFPFFDLLGSNKSNLNFFTLELIKQQSRDSTKFYHHAVGNHLIKNGTLTAKYATLIYFNRYEGGF
jgi:hypothetical protein